MGVTAHFLDDQFCMHTYCLGVERMKGSHTADAIYDKFHNILSEFGLHNKVVKVVSDDASNMRKAFELQIFSEADEKEEPHESDEVVEDADISDADIAASLEKMEQAEVEITEVIDQMIASSEYSRIKCFNHSLHNVVGDGLKVAGRRFDSAVAKVQKLAALKKKSALFSDVLEENFGTEVGFALAVKTRWNSQYRMIEKFLELDSEKMEASIAKHEKADKLSVIEMEALQECLNVLGGFQEATLMTEGDQAPTLNSALPLLLSLVSILQSQVGQTKHCGNFINGLLLSIYKRFNGLLQLVHFSAVCGPPFVEEQNNNTWKDDIFLVAPFLDPRMKLKWVDSDCDFLSPEQKQTLKENVQTLVLQMITNSPNCEPVPSKQLEVPANCGEGSETRQTKRPKVLPYLFGPQKQQPSPIKTSPHLEILQYIEEDSDCSVQEFWRASRNRFPNLAKLAQQILSVVASSSPVERVFSIGGYMMRPHRARLSPTTLKFLVFLRCNFELIP